MGSATAGPASTLDELLREYRERTPQSRAFSERLIKVMPGGETRAVVFYLPYPLALSSASGPRVVDVDGNTYLDLANNMASLIHGHRFPPVLDAINEAAAKLGTAQAGPHQYQLEFAEMLVRRFPALESVRFTNSGSEAALLALRIARHATGRRRFVMFDGGYHGLGPEFMEEAAPEVVRVPYNDLDALSEALDDTIAAVFVEPFLGSKGIVPALDGFLEGVKARAENVGAVVVFDEVQAVRAAFNGYHGSIGFEPDLILYGKPVGGGLPVGIVGGRNELLDHASARRPDSLIHSGTFNGNVVTSAAGIQALTHLDPEAIDLLNERAISLSRHIETVGAALGFEVSVSRCSSIMCVHFRSEVPQNADEARPTTHLSAWFHIACLLEGLYVTRGGRMNLSTPMTDSDMAEIGDAMSRALERLAAIRETVDEESALVLAGSTGKWDAGR